MGGDCLGLHAPPITLVASPIDSCIAIQELPVPTRRRYPYPIAMAGNRRQVADTKEAIGLIPGPAKKRNHGLFCIAKVYPLEPSPVEIYLV